MKTVAAIACAALLAGCAPKAFVHPNPAANLVADASQCEYEIQMNQRGVYVPWFYNNNQAAGYFLGAAIGSAIRNDQLRTLCMQAKGYRAIALDTIGPTPIGEPQVTLPGIAPTAQFIPAYVAASSVAPASAANAPLRWYRNAETTARLAGCTSGMAAQATKDPAVEIFVASCPNGGAVNIQCEVYGCRVIP